MCSTAFSISCMYLLEPEEPKYRVWNLRGRDVWVTEKGWCSRFTERFRILKETNPEILPVYPKQKPNIGVVVGKQLQSINFMLFFKNPIFLRKFLLIKLQIYWQTGQAKSDNSSKYHSFWPLYFTLFIFRALPIPAVGQRSTLCARVLLKYPHPISGFWDLSTLGRQNESTDKWMWSEEIHFFVKIYRTSTYLITMLILYLHLQLNCTCYLH